MLIFLTFLFTFLLILASLSFGLFVGYPLMAGLLLFSLLSLHYGHNQRQLSAFLATGLRKSLPVLKIFVLIGGITGTWMAAGTVPAIVYYSLQILHPSLYYLVAFLACCLVSMLIGTALGTCGTMGIALITLARSGDANLAMAAGAIIAGAYFGDRFSPMSGSANLVATLTGTNLFENLRNMARTMLLPFLITVVLYTLLSIGFPLQPADGVMSHELLESFQIGWKALLPAIIMILLSFFQINVKIAMGSSLVAALAVTVFHQHYSLTEAFRFMVLGFSLPASNPLYEVIQGGGLVSMALPAVIVLTSCMLAEVIYGSHFLDPVIQRITGSITGFKRFGYMILTSFITAGFGGNQTVSIVFTANVMQDNYQWLPDFQQRLALDLEDSSVIIAALIPWNIAAMFPTTVLQVDRVAFLPFAFYLYVLPLCSWFSYWIKKPQSLSPTKSLCTTPLNDEQA